MDGHYYHTQAQPPAIYYNKCIETQYDAKQPQRDISLRREEMLNRNIPTNKRKMTRNGHKTTDKHKEIQQYAKQPHQEGL